MSLMKRYKNALMTTILLVIISPLFGIVLANAVGYHEPLDVAAEMLHLHEVNVGYWTPFSDYTVPGLPDTVGYIVAGFIGISIILSIGYLLAKVSSSERAS